MGVKQDRKVYTNIVRIENPKDGCGPYISRFANDDLRDKMMEKTSAYVSKSHPPPQRDGLTESQILDLGCWVCGCKDIRQLKKWFGEFLPELIESGFKVYRYRLPRERVLYGNHQVVFNPNESVKRCEVAILN
jgi:hypothetical protein